MRNETGAVTGAKKKKKSKKIIALALVAALGLGLFAWSRMGGSESTQDGYLRAPVEHRTIVQTLKDTGTLRPANSYIVTTLVEGDVLQADFEEGDTVEKDTVLYRIDPSDLSTSIERSQISLDQAQRSYNTALDRKNVRSTVAGTLFALQVKPGDSVTMNQTLATIRDSGTMVLQLPFPAIPAAEFYPGQAASVTLDGTFEVLPGTVQTVSGETVGAGNLRTRTVTIHVKNPGGLGTAQAAAATVNGVPSTASGTFRYKAEATLVATMAGVVEQILVPQGGTVAYDQPVLVLGGRTLEDQIKAAADSLRSAELAMESTRQQLDNYTIQSPIRGTIVDKQYKTGDTISGAARQLCTIYDLSWLEMVLAVDELDIRDVAVGQRVQVTADAVEGQQYSGVITKVSVAGTTVGGVTSYPVTVRLDSTGELLPGMNADAEIVLTTREDVPAIPAGAVQRGGLVLVTADSPSAANADPSVEAPAGYAYVRVTTGISDEEYVEILSGLQAGDTVAYTQVTSNLLGFLIGAGGGDMSALMGGAQ